MINQHKLIKVSINQFWQFIIVISNTTKEILRFFTLEQVVSDVAQLVTKVKEDFDSPNSRVILFGNFLGGTAAVLARKRFPHLVDGVWSSGGVFKAAVPENSMKYGEKTSSEHVYYSNSFFFSILQ